MGEDPTGFTLDDILATTHTSKGQLFHYFPGGREELLLEVARSEARRVLEDQQPHLIELDSWTAWDHWRRAVVARYQGQGTNCPMSALMAQEASVPGASSIIRSLLDQWHEHLRQGVVEMQRRGLIGAAVDAAGAASALIAGIQGGVVLYRSTGDIRHLEAALDVLLSHLRSTVG